MEILTPKSSTVGQICFGNRGIKNAADTHLLLEAICNEKDHQRCIERILGSSHALNALQSGLRFDLSTSFINQHLAAFLRYLSDPVVKELCNGQFLRNLLMIIIEPPTLWRALVTSAKGRLLGENALPAFAWLLFELVILSELYKSEILEDAQQILTSRLLHDSELHEVRTYGHKIQHVLETRCASMSFDQGSVAGGRHDNDFEDFRQIAIFPTADEFLSSEKPFYRRADTISEAKPENRVAMYLDNQFRLLREDMLAELREDLLVATGKKKSRRQSFVLFGLSVVGLYSGEEKKRKPAALAIQCKSGLEQLKSRAPKERKKYLQDNRGFLKHQSFGCIIYDDTIVAFATLDRNEEALLKDPPVIMLHVLGDEPLRRALMALKLRHDLRFILVDTPIFAYEPILKCLQERVDLPLADKLLNIKAEGQIRQESLLPSSFSTTLSQSVDRNIGEILQTTKTIKLDQSQMASLIQGLTQPLSLIQGPPGKSTP